MESFANWGAALALELFPFEYGYYVLFLVLIFHYSKSEILLRLVLNALFLPIMPLQVFSVLEMALIKAVFYVGRVPRWMRRSFYPAHLLIIVGILYLLMLMLILTNIIIFIIMEGLL